MVSLNKVSPSDCDNDRQLEMALWPAKPKIPDGAKKRPEHSQVLYSSVIDRF